MLQTRKKCVYTCKRTPGNITVDASFNTVLYNYVDIINDCVFFY